MALMMVVSFIPFSVLGFYSDTFVHEQLVRQAHETQMALATSTARTVEHFWWERIKDVALMASARDIQDPQVDPASKRTALEAWHATCGDLYTDLTLLDLQGNVLASTTGQTASQVGEPWLKAAQRGQPHISNLWQLPTGERVFLVSAPVRDGAEGPVIGVLVAQVEAKALWSITDAVQLGDTGYVYVVDQRGVTVAHGHRETSGVHLHTFVLWTTGLTETLVGVTSYGVPIIQSVGLLDLTVATQEALLASEPRSFHYYWRDTWKTNAIVPLQPYHQAGSPIVFTNPHGWTLVVTQADDDFLGAVHQLELTGALLSLLALALSVFTAWAFARWTTSPIQRIMAVMRAVREGDYSQRVQVKRQDETGRLAQRLNAMLDEIVALMDAQQQGVQTIIEMAQNMQATSEQVSAAAEQLSASAEQLNTSAEQVSLTMHEIAKGAAVQAEEVERVSHTLAGLTAATQRITGNAAASGQAAQDVYAVVQAASDVLRELGVKSGQIGGIITLVDRIADQTQILSLNAAIEAARAGEYGRGFAVVADEVRRLAENSANAVSEISALSTQIQQETTRLAQRMDQLNTAIETATTLSTETAQATSQQEAGTDRIVRAMNEMAAVAEQNAAATQQVSAAVEEQTASMQEIAASAQELADVAVRMQALVGDLAVTEALPRLGQRRPHTL